MGEAFITRRGGGGKIFAAIGVAYPTGSECTCENKTSGRVLRAMNTSGKWVFSIPSKGSWTVKATLDGKDFSQTLTVEEGKVYDVTLNQWSGELYNNGNEFTETTGGWVAYSGTLTKNAESLTFFAGGGTDNLVAQTANPVDVTSYNTLTIEVFAPTDALCYFGLSNTKQPTYSLTDPDMSYKTTGFSRHDGKTTYTVDISGAQGLMYPTYMSYSGTSHLYSAKLS